MPTTAPRSTTRSAEILWLISSSASATSASGAMVRGLLGHDACDRGVERKIGLQTPAQVAVGDDAGERLAVEHRHAPEALRAHLDDRLGHPRLDVDAGDALAGVHHLAHMGEFGAELAARMKGAEIDAR